MTGPRIGGLGRNRGQGARAEICGPVQRRSGRRSRSGTEAAGRIRRRVAAFARGGRGRWQNDDTSAAPGLHADLFRVASRWPVWLTCRLRHKTHAYGAKSRVSTGGAVSGRVRLVSHFRLSQDRRRFSVVSQFEMDRLKVRVLARTAPANCAGAATFCVTMPHRQKAIRAVGPLVEPSRGRASAPSSDSGGRLEADLTNRAKRRITDAQGT